MRVERDQLITLGLLLAMVAGFLAVHWAPRRIQVARLNARVAAARAELASASPPGGRLVTLARDVARLEQNAAAQRREVPREPGLGGLLRHLTAELENLQVADQEMQTQPTVKGANFAVIPVTLRFRGSFASAFTLLHKAESLPRLVRPTLLELRGDVSKRHEPLQVRLELCAFYIPPEEARP